MELRYPLTRYVYRPVSVPIASALARTPVTPLQVTLVGALLSLGGGVAFGFRQFLLGAGLTLAGSIIDCVDGDLARASGRASPSGSYLDHVLDRWTDAALIAGLAFSNLDALAPVAILALIATFMTSYTRTKAQAVGVDADVGIASRDARMLVLVLAAVASLVALGLWIVAVLGVVTSVHRMIFAIRRLDAPRG